MAKGKLWNRHSPLSLEQDLKGDPKGRIFESRAGIKDLTKILVCGSSVDTVKQLYNGSLKPDLLEQLQNSLEDGLFRFQSGFGEIWHSGKMAKISGYRYKLQNNDLGVIILIASYYSKEDQPGSHLKIELSPHFIAGRGIQQIQDTLDLIAHNILTDYQAAGVAVHLALDVQNWQPPQDFQERFSTYARAVRSYDGIVDFQFDDLSTIAVKYGKTQAETYMFGKANALQTCIYDKTKEIQTRDKVDYFQRYWEAYTFGQYNPEKPVWRIEMRLHHRIIREIGEGMEETLEAFHQVTAHLTDIWRYALNRNRLDHSSVYIDPAWQLFLEEAEFYLPPNGVYMRRKKKQDDSAIGKNISFLVGNLVSLCARHHHTAPQVMKQLKRLDCYEDIVRYYRSRNLTESDLRQHIEKGLCLRRLIGKAA
ncbi:hypothetical protein [Methyloterricola oryzae]|uniref:hypothetical protein n=1 Tax=Methyloterricola oryzae TaxID=1495050 RepID=UPI0005EB935B|nr:hypothetical protein [Methyloterricola oryzae]